MGGAGRQEQLALGEIPNIAARIQGLAAPNTIAISEVTYRLIQGYFECEALGGQTLRGVAEPLTSTASSVTVVPQNRLDIVSDPWSDTISWSRERSHIPRGTLGTRAKLVRGRWSYSRGMQALARVVWSKCSKSMSPTSHICAGNVEAYRIIKTPPSTP